MAKARKQITDTGTIELQRLQDAVIEIPIVGLTSLVSHRWSEKAKRMMPGHPDGDTIKKAKGKREPKAEADAGLYLLGKSLAFPATAFKAAIVGACRFFEKPSMTEAKQLLFVEGEGPEQLVRIRGNKELREDVVRIGKGMSKSADLRYRYYIHEWDAVLRVRYLPIRMSKESVIALMDAAGRGGVGDRRPSSPESHTGTYGTWRVDATKAVKDVA